MEVSKDHFEFDFDDEYGRTLWVTADLEKRKLLSVQYLGEFLPDEFFSTKFVNRLLEEGDKAWKIDPPDDDAPLSAEDERDNWVDLMIDFQKESA